MAEPVQPDAAADGDAPVTTQSREEQLLAALASMRELLGRGLFISRDRLQEAFDEAVRHGRMTRQDSEELLANVVAIGRRQAQDTLLELEAMVGRSATQTRRLSGNVGAVARRAPGSDRALRGLDRMRRAAGIGAAFPIMGYDDLTMAQIKDRLDELSSAQLRKVRDFERRNANRTSILSAIEQRLR